MAMVPAPTRRELPASICSAKPPRKLECVRSAAIPPLAAPALAALAKRGLAMRSAMEVDSLDAVEALLRHGLGLSVLPRRARPDPAAGPRRLALPAGGLPRQILRVCRAASARRVFAARVARALRPAATRAWGDLRWIKGG